MPPLPPVANVARCVINTLYNGEVCANVLHYRNTSPGAQASMNALAEALAAEYITNIIPHVPNTLTFVNVTASDLDPTPSAPGFSSVGSNTPGAQTNEQLPNNVAACLTLRTAVGGRSGRGRIYHVGVGNDDVIANAWEPTFATDLIAGYTAMRNLSASDQYQWTWCIVSYYSAGSLRGTPMVNDVQSITMDGTADSMRRRLPGH